jgi:hypothetical protein
MQILQSGLDEIFSCRRRCKKCMMGIRGAKAAFQMGAKIARHVSAKFARDSY